MKLDWSQVRWGIIGCGDVTEVKSGPALQKVWGSKVVHVMRRNASMAEDYARRHLVPRCESKSKSPFYFWTRDFFFLNAMHVY